ncbi:MAG: HD domain-containing protein [Treponema sp.]|jgi:GTP pyrophosphokinase|nr:HD domain-containing protein [Treponema sp.]
MTVENFAQKLTPYSADDAALILEAAALAEKSCPANLNHHLGTAAILAELRLDAPAIIAVLLRDCAGGPDAAESIAGRFGNLRLIEEAARIAAVNAVNETAAEAENIRKMLFAMAGDIRVILIKLADKLDAMRSLELVPSDQHKRVAQECLDIYAPLADRLGISWIKDELEDLALKYLNRGVYLQIKEIVALKRGERRLFLESARALLTAEAEKAGIAVEFQSRAKHFYSIYQKMRRRGKAAGDLYDLFGIRLLCDTIDACYTLLGLVHRLWKPVDGRFKDYIAMPKSNGYRSLHTTVFAGPGGLERSGPDARNRGEAEQEDAPSPETGGILEIQIRTREMHQTAEYGVAGHWLYKTGFTRNAETAEIALVNKLKEWNRSVDESQIFLDDIKRELLGDSIYVFTPAGKVIELPSGATPLDFAYRIHSAVGDHCSLARVDGAVYPLGASLKNTQVVEIVTATAARPTANWLRSVKTSKARNRIRSWLLENDEAFARDMRKKAETGDLRHEQREEAESRGPGAKAEEPQRLIQAGVFKVRVEDEKNMLVRFAKCCKPVLGDSIAGYVSRGRGIIIHRDNCPNTAHIPDFAERMIEARWEDSSLLIKRFRIEAKNRGDLFSEIEGAVRKFQGHLIEGRLEESGTNRLTGYFTMQLENRGDVARVLKHLRGIPAVSGIQGLG